MNMVEVVLKAARAFGVSLALVLIGAGAQAVLQIPEPGFRLVDGQSIVNAINEWNQQQATTALTALAGGGQTGSTQLNYGFNDVATVASSADSVQLPPCSIGAAVIVTNSGANPTTVYGKAGRTDTINTTAGATGVSQTNGAHSLYICGTPGATTGGWFSIRASS